MNITFQNMAKHCKYSVLYLLNTIQMFVTFSPCTLVLFFDFSFPFTTFLDFMYLLVLFFVYQYLGGKTNLVLVSLAKIGYETNRHILVHSVSSSYHCKRKKYFLWKVLQRMLCSVVLEISRYYHKQLHEHTTGMHSIN